MNLLPSCQFPIRCSPQIAEALAMLRGLQLAKEILLLSASLESDALYVINLISSSRIPESELGLLISYNLEFLINLCFVGASFIPRSAKF
ncbi:hypothetical protein JRO89_XS03G0197100 [Xanthoceras sorbifolium]|uniref:RNase H type-1 domain-containing protein n=1 Tax=Xanthoceras sorbifolium TaxID=99658 RepID=A0ABQ8IB60_9ROSI|nr:hypothetical protein JRO89_XS03G0197100 [Xanthoceras sorbifolium]